jgi:alpha-mannosidase
MFCLVVAAGLISPVSANLRAQAPGPSTPPAAIAPISMNKLAALTTLKELPAADWKSHAGDLAHGELLNLDESSWQAAPLKSSAPMDAVWYRAWVEVPATLHGYDLTGSRIWFQFHAHANGPMPQIVYFAGRRVAMGDDLEPIVLFENAKPHQRVLVAVKLLNTIDEKVFQGATLKIDFPANRPSPSDLLTEFETAQQLIPVLSTNEAADVASLERAIQMVDDTALAKADQKGFDDSLAKAQAALQAVKPTLERATISLTGNAHIDAAWLWPWSEATDVVKRTFSTALQLMEEYPDYTFVQSSAAYNEWIADKFPVIDEQIKKRVREGRWEIVGGMWVEPDLNLPDGESQLRSLLLGKRWFKQNYGVDVRIGWNPDSFGYDWQLPQIYKKSGIDYFVTQKENWNDTDRFPVNLFWWESPDGSRVLTYFPTDYVHLDLNPVRLAKDFSVVTHGTAGMTETMDLYGVGDHGGGPTRAIFDEGLHWMQPGMVGPRLKFATVQGFFDDIQTKLSDDPPEWDYRKIGQGYKAPAAQPDGRMAIPVWNSEMYFEYHRGIMTTQAAHKNGMRKSEEETLDAERYAALAWLRGQAYPGKELTADWKKVTFNDFHDLAGGSGIGDIYKDSQQDFEVVRLSTNAITRKSLELLASDIDTNPKSKPANSAAVLVLNPLAWRRNEVIEASVELPEPADAVEAVGPHGPLAVQVVAHTAGSNRFDLLIQAGDVPSLGYSLIHLAGVKGGANKPAQTEVKATGATLENAKLRVTVDPTTGCITSLYDKRASFEAIAKGGCGNELQAFNDNPTQYDAWNIDSGTLDHPIPLGKAEKVELVEKGPLRASIRVTHVWRNSKFVQAITLDADADTVDVISDIDWHETHILLKAAVPLAASSAFATFEIPYGTIDRPTTRNNSWEKAQFEVPSLRWADLGDGQHGLSLLNESKYGYDALGNTLRLSLLRSPVWPDPEADRGQHHFSYALYPHAGDWKQALAIRRGYNYNYPLHAAQVLEHDGSLPAEHSFIRVTPDNVVLTAVKKSEDADALILHFYEWAGKETKVKIEVPAGASSAELTDLMENPSGKVLSVEAGSVTVPVGKYAIESLRVNYPVKGTGAQ